MSGGSLHDQGGPIRCSWWTFLSTRVGLSQNITHKLEIMSKPAIEDSYLYVASKKSKVFHKMTCEHVATIKEENLIYFYSLEEAQASGRRGCKQCKPEE